MTTLRVEKDNILSNPLDLAEQVIADRDWDYDWPSEDEIVAEAKSAWGNYHLSFNWEAEQGAMTFACMFETKIPKIALEKFYQLLAMANEKLWIGHFDLASDGSIAFRHTMLMRDGCVVASEQFEDLVDIAIVECERFFPAFQAIIWSNKTAEEALVSAMFETVGEA